MAIFNQFRGRTSLLFVYSDRSGLKIDSHLHQFVIGGSGMHGLAIRSEHFERFIGLIEFKAGDIGFYRWRQGAVAKIHDAVVAVL